MSDEMAMMEPRFHRAAKKPRLEVVGGTDIDDAARRFAEIRSAAYAEMRALLKRRAAEIRSGCFDGPVERDPASWMMAVAVEALILADMAQGMSEADARTKLCSELVVFGADIAKPGQT